VEAVGNLGDAQLRGLQQEGGFHEEHLVDVISSLFSHNRTDNSKTFRTFAHEKRINEYRKEQTYDNNDCTDSHRAGGLVRADASLDGLGVPQGGYIRQRFREASRV